MMTLPPSYIQRAMRGALTGIVIIGLCGILTPITVHGQGGSQQSESTSITITFDDDDTYPLNIISGFVRAQASIDVGTHDTEAGNPSGSLASEGYAGVADLTESCGWADGNTLTYDSDTGFYTLVLDGPLNGYHQGVSCIRDRYDRLFSISTATSPDISRIQYVNIYEDGQLIQSKSGVAFQFDTGNTPTPAIDELLVVTGQWAAGSGAVLHFRAVLSGGDQTASLHIAFTNGSQRVLAVGYEIRGGDDGQYTYQDSYMVAASDAKDMDTSWQPVGIMTPAENRVATDSFDITWRADGDIPFSIDNVTLYLGDAPSYQRYVRPLTPDTRSDHVDIYETTKQAGIVHLQDMYDFDRVFTNYLVQPYNPSNYYPSPGNTRAFLEFGEPLFLTTLDSSPPLKDANEYLLFYRSLSPGDLIHAPVNGVVSSISPLLESDCSTLSNKSFGRAELAGAIIAGGLTLLTEGAAAPLTPAVIAITKLLADEDEHQYCEMRARVLKNAQSNRTIDLALTPYTYTTSDPSWLVPFEAISSLLFVGAGDIVEIEDRASNTTLYYLVADADRYVTEGQTISAGCVIGRTLMAFYWDGSKAQFDQNGGFGLIWAENRAGQPFNVIERYQLEPTSDTPCNLPIGGACLNGNPDFDATASPVYWQGNVTWHSGGGHELSGDGLADVAQVIVGTGQPLSVQIAGYVQTPNENTTDSVVTVTLGDTDHVFNFPASGAEFSDYTPLATYVDSDFDGNIYDLELSSSDQTGTVVVTRLCVAMAVPPETPVPECLFPNAGFNSSANWELEDAGPNSPRIYDGALDLPPGTYARTTVNIRADDYSLGVRYRPEPTLFPPVEGFSISLEWYLYEPDGVTLIDNGVFEDVNGARWVEASTYLFVPAHYTNAIFELSTADSGSDSVEIDFVCLTPEDIPRAPDTENSTECQACAARYLGQVSHDLPEAASWLDCRARQLYYCDYRAIVDDIRTNTNNTVTGIGMMGRWLSTSTGAVGRWLAGAFYYIGGHFNNLSRAVVGAIAGQVGGNTTIIQGGNANLFDVLGLLITGLRDVLVTFLNNLLSAINLLLPIAGMLIDAATQVLTGLEAIMAAAINQLGQIVLIVQAIIQAASVDPQSIPGAPNCAGLATGTADWYCWGFYILDNTIFSGPAAILLPLVMAAAALNFMLWSFGEFRRTMAEV